MNLSVVANLADLLAAAGVIASLLFLAFQMREGGKQSKIANWHTTMQAIKETKRRTDSPYVADVVERGRRDFLGLSDAEKLTYSGYMEDLILGYEPFIVHGDAIAVGRRDTDQVVRAAYSGAFSHPGARQWWEWSDAKRRWPLHMTETIASAISGHMPSDA